MSVDIFYFCADPQRVARWWQQPLAALVAELAPIAENDATSVGSIDVGGYVSEAVIAPLDVLQAELGSDRSLSMLLRQTLETIAADQGRSFGQRLATMLGSGDRREREQAQARLATLIELYGGLHLAAHVGPSTDAVDLRAYNALQDQLATHLPPPDAAHYDPQAALDTLGPLAPPELNELRDRLPPQYRELGASFVWLEAAAWQQRWARLLTIPDFWEQFGREQGDWIVPHFRAIVDVAAYAVANNARMLQPIN
jgi:hypothetical protein